MPGRRLLSAREEVRGLQLAARQPESGQELGELIEKVRPRVLEAVLADPRVQERLAGTRYRMVGAGLREEKPDRDGEVAPRLAEVGVYEYDSDTLLVAVVDLRSGQVERLEERRDIQPPLTTQEVEEARAIVASNPQLARLKRVPASQIVALPSRASSIEGHRLAWHRCFNLTFWSGGRKKLAEAAVDLSTRELVPLEDADPLDLADSRR